MKKFVKYYIVTYNQPEQLQITYNTLLKTMPTVNSPSYRNFEINVINNHSNFKLDERDYVACVYHNQLRPDNSYGYLARNWNQAILLGFKNTVNPDTEWVGLVQSDVVFQEGWFEKFLKIKDIDLFQWGPGDQFVLLNIGAFKKVGWFDERFTSLAMQEYDYLLRTYIHLKERCMLQGHYGKRGIFNSPPFNAIAREEKHRTGHSTAAHQQQHRWFNVKWGPKMDNILRGGGERKWAQVVNELLHKGKLQVPKEINWYPYIYEGDSSRYEIYV